MFMKKEREKDWGWFFGTCQDQQDLAPYAMKVLERNISHVLRHGSLDCLVFIGTNTNNAKTRAKIIRALARGNSNVVKKILKSMAEKGRWKDLAQTAMNHSKLENYAAGLMERNFEQIVQSGNLHAIVFLYCNSNQDQIGRMLVEGLLAHERKEEACIVLEWMARRNDWESLMIESEFPGNPDNIGSYAFLLLEENYKKVLDSRNMEAVDYLMRKSSDSKTLREILNWSVRTNDVDFANRAFELVAEKKMWGSLIRAIERTKYRSRIRRNAMAILDQNIRNICKEADCESIIRLWEITESDEIRAEILGTIATVQRTEQKKLLDFLRNTGDYKWLEYFEWLSERFGGSPANNQAEHEPMPLSAAG
jgi:hypothetical protein